MTGSYRRRSIWIGGVLVLAIGLVLFIALPMMRSGDRPETKARYQLSVVKQLLHQWHEKYGVYPAKVSQLEELLGANIPPESRARMYRDPWGEQMAYRYPSTDSSCEFQLYSKGPNRQDDQGGGDDINTDSDGQRPGCVRPQ